MLNKLYTSRKSAVIRYLLTCIICAVSAMIFGDKTFRAFMLAVTGISLAVHWFWKGYDAGDFAAFYAQENLNRRDKYLRCFSFL